MGALSADIPFVELVWASRWVFVRTSRGLTDAGGCGERAGGLTEEKYLKLIALVPTVSTCGVMGTASTMALLVEALGLAPLGSATAPAVSADRLRIAEQTGVLAVDIAKRHRNPADFLTMASFENALRVLLAVGGSTNAIIHLTAIAGRLGIKLADRLDELSKQTLSLLTWFEQAI